MKYVVITPVRDEESYIEKTITSVVSQTCKPSQWIIVNDGSTDKTGEIIDRYCAEHPWITVIHRENRGFRKSGGGVMEAFYDGYANLKVPDFDYIVKLDGDLSFESDYFAKCFMRFSQEPRLGIGGGVIHNLINDEVITEKNPAFHVRGATKIYKRECWEAIGSLVKAPGWDTLDEVKATQKGWKTYSFQDLILYQHKLTGSADGGWKNCLKNGRGCYTAGYHPLYLLIKCIRWVTARPYCIASLGLFIGFFSSYLKKIPRIDDKELIKFLRKEQLKKIFFRKSMWV
jgi:glycosyltransferase involved in cell wall biosynthesis